MRVTSLLLLLLCLCALLSCNRSRDYSPVRIGIITPSINHLPISLAIEQRYINTSKVQVVTFTSGWELQEAITSNKIDMAIMPFTYGWTSIAKGYKLKIISCLERETDGILALPSLRTMDSLNNKKIGLLRASTLDVLMQDTAKKMNIKYTPVYFRTPSEMYAALHAKDVQAIVSYVPLIQKKGAEYHVVHWFSDTYPGHPCCDLIATEGVLQAKPEVVSLIENGLKKAVTDINKPTDESVELLQRLYSLDRVESIESLKHTVFRFSISDKDKQFERQMMQYFLINDYVTRIPSINDVYGR